MMGSNLRASAEGLYAERIMKLHQERLLDEGRRNHQAAVAPRQPRSRPYPVRLLGRLLVTLGRSLEGAELQARTRP